MCARRALHITIRRGWGRSVRPFFSHLFDSTFEGRSSAPPSRSGHYFVEFRRFAIAGRVCFLDVDDVLNASQSRAEEARKTKTRKTQKT